MTLSASLQDRPDRKVAPLVPRVDQLLDAAQSLIQQRGYNGFSYEDLAQIVGIRKPSIHHHFPKKEDLGVRVIRRYAERFQHMLEAIQHGTATTAGRLGAYIELFSTTYGTTRKLCPCGILGAESPTLPDSITNAVADFFTLNLTWLAALLEQGRGRGQLTFIGAPDTQALLLLSALEGAMVVGRGSGNMDSVNSVGSALVAQLIAS
jgi:TetR/AcrR family transcriptional repressor of nem operon